MNRRDFTKLIGLTGLAAGFDSVPAMARKPAPQFSITMDDFFWQNAVKLTAAERNHSILDALRTTKASSFSPRGTTRVTRSPITPTRIATSTRQPRTSRHIRTMKQQVDVDPTRVQLQSLLTMNRLLLSTCMLLVITSSVVSQVSDVSLTTAADPSSWKRYTAKDEAFSIVFPTVPAMATSREFLGDGQRERRIRELGAYADGIVYIVYSVENPGPKQSLERFIKERFGNFETREVTVSGVAGKEPAVQKGDIVRKYFATERHLYVFSTLGAPASDPRVQQFFSSLVLDKNREGIEVSDGPGITLQPPVQAEPVDADLAPKSYLGRDRKVRLGMKPQPAYTNAARLNGVTGTVVLKVIFSSTGEVNNIRTVSGLPYGLTEKAIDAARKIKFIPAVKDGKFVSVWMQLEYNFNL